MANIQQIIEKFKAYNPSGNSALIERAYQFALRAHQGQKRLSGEDYISHCLAAAKTLIDWKLDSETIAAGLLHDVLDDTQTPQKDLKKEFGENVLGLTEGVRKLDKIKYQGTERMVENFRKLILATAKDIRVILIKLADRLHNMQTLSVLPQEKQKRIALETLEIYAPIANRLAMGELKGQLEDLSFPYVYPQKYQWLIGRIKEKYQEREKYLKNIRGILEEELKKTGLKIIDIHPRAKHHYSLYKKLLRYEMDLDKIYDLVALRIIVPKIEDCYAVLGVIHKLWKPLPGRIKDYIALPKPNGYQSLHTTVFTLDGQIVEIQIRTQEMHREAEYGIAAHWHYDEGKGLKKYFQKLLPIPQILSPIQQILSPAKINQEAKLPSQTQIPSKHLNWVKELQKWQTEKFDAPEEFFKSLKIDFFKDRIFVFTPLGDVIDLPEGATPIDFAYQIHTDIGHACAEAKIDGKLSSLSQPLQNGQIVKIITKKIKKPSRDWLKFVKTHEAKSKIKAWFRQKNQAEQKNN